MGEISYEEASKLTGYSYGTIRFWCINSKILKVDKHKYPHLINKNSLLAYIKRLNRKRDLHLF